MSMTPHTLSLSIPLLLDKIFSAVFDSLTDLDGAFLSSSLLLLFGSTPHFTTRTLGTCAMCLLLFQCLDSHNSFTYRFVHCYCRFAYGGLW
jgi:hypothetical protein